MKWARMAVGGLVCACAHLSWADKGEWIQRSDVHAMEVLNVLAQFQPESAAAYGLNQFDSQVIDLREGIDERRTEAEQALLVRLADARADEEDPHVIQDLQILETAVQDGIEARQVNREALLPYFDLHLLFFQSFRSILDPRNDPERFESALDRLRRYVGREEGYVPIVDLAIARTTERFDVAGLQGPYRGALDNAFASAPRYLAGVRDMFSRSGLVGWEDNLALLEQQLGRYSKWLENEIVPRSRDDNVLPPAIYANNLKNFGVDATPQELIREAQAAYQFIRSEMKAVARLVAAKRGWKDGELLSVMQRLKSEQVPQDELLALYQQRLAQIEQIIERESIVSLPSRDAVIRLATEAEAAAVPASFMSPPQLIGNTGQYGEFVLVQSNPTLGPEAQMDDWSHDAITWALTVHEARPGHEMQFASLVENGTSLARALFAFNSANVEGWGLYAEAIMHEYLPLEGQLFSLFTRLMRAARMFLDPMVNTGAITRDDAERFLVEQGGLSRAMASSEADRYAFRAPGQATSYYYGYQSLMRLRTEVELATGNAFDQQAFHDFVLRQGLLPPELLREAVLQRFQQ